MSILSMVEARLPPGFRFHPTDDELVCDYLSHRAITTATAAAAIDGIGFHGFPAMVDIDLNKCEPWDLPDVACIRGKEWYFFSLKDKKYATGQRTNRATRSGYWKATGKDRHVLRKGALVGKKKTLVFYQGRAPKGKKTQWVMHEFRMECSSHSPNFSSFKEDWVLCRVFYKCRSLSSKITMETCDEDAGSSSLPPLMDSQITSYDQASLRHEELEQVPCFSSFSASQAAANVSSSSSSLNTFSYDKKVLKVVLSKLEENQQINGGSCFTDSGILIPSLWNPFGGF